MASKYSKPKIKIVRAKQTANQWPPTGATNVLDIHSILGANIDGKEFIERFNNLDQLRREKIIGVSSRLQLVNALQYETGFSSSWNRVQSDTLQVYLLCTCLDALAGQMSYRHFHDWLLMDEQSKHFEDFKENAASVEEPSSRSYRKVIERLGSKWLDEYGVGRNLRRYINELPDVLRKELVNSYAIIKEPTEQKKDWSGYSEAKRLKRVIEYLYDLRRNTFTHQARIVPTIVPTRGISGWVSAIPSKIWKYTVYFTNADEVRGEISLLRIVIIGGIRQLMSYPVDQAFVDLHWTVESMRRLIRLALQELDINENLRFFFLKTLPVDLARSPTFAIPPRFKWQKLEKLCKSRSIDFSWFFPLSREDDKEFREQLQSYIAKINRVNVLVDKYEDLSLRPRVWDKTKIAAFEKIRVGIRDDKWTQIGETIATNLYYILESPPEIFAQLKL